MEIATSFNEFVFPQASLMTIELNVRNNLIPEVINIEDVLGTYGVSRYNGQQMIDMYTLNEILYEFVDLTDLEFEIVCAILYSRRLGDLNALNWACKVLKSGRYEYIKITPDGKGVLINIDNLSEQEGKINKNGFNKNPVNVFEIIERALSGNVDMQEIGVSIEDRARSAYENTNEFGSGQAISDSDRGEPLSYQDMLLLMQNGYEQCSRGFLSIKEGVK